MESSKKKGFGLILLLAGLVFILVNILVVYPYINCEFAPLTFWLLAIIGAVGGLLLYFDVNIFHEEES